MKIFKMYFLSVLLNILPTALLYVFVVIDASANGTTIKGESTLGFYFTIPLFIASCFFNLSFFLLKFDVVRKGKIKYFSSFYLSSIFFFFISILWFSYLILELIENNVVTVINVLETCLYNGLPFYICIFR